VALDRNPYPVILYMGVGRRRRTIIKEFASHPEISVF